MTNVKGTPMSTQPMSKDGDSATDGRKMTMPEPTHRRQCRRTGCNRTVGPYYDEREADAALAHHDHVAHGGAVQKRSYFQYED